MAHFPLAQSIVPKALTTDNLGIHNYFRLCKLAAYLSHDLSVKQSRMPALDKGATDGEAKLMTRLHWIDDEKEVSTERT